MERREAIKLTGSAIGGALIGGIVLESTEGGNMSIEEINENVVMIDQDIADYPNGVVRIYEVLENQGNNTASFTFVCEFLDVSDVIVDYSEVSLTIGPGETEDHTFTADNSRISSFDTFYKE